MDADRFEGFLRSLSASPSRRSAVRILAGLVVGSWLAHGTGEIAAHNALKRCKKLKDKDRRRQCVRKAKQHNAQHTRCIPQCAGKSCGDDGCDGSCGTCTGGQTCCGGRCVNSTCTGDQQFEQAQCRCCIGFGLSTTCTTSDDCCSRVCVDHPTEPRDFCSCIARGVSCDVDENCCGGTCKDVAGDRECDCHAQGTICTDPAQCCDGLSCEGLDIPAGQPGTCQP